MPSSLVYGCEAVIPLEIQMPSLRVALITKITSEDNDRLRLQELEALDEKHYKLSSTLSCIKLGSQKPSIRKSNKVSFRKEIWF